MCAALWQAGRYRAHLGGRSAKNGVCPVWVTDHLFVPRTMEIIYRDNMLEPLALLSHLAAVVPRVCLGTSVLILPYRNPSLSPRCWRPLINSRTGG
jgi:alkanesulfonate monooxygenase SsuD/methylene tetrahydromethanopterin reductase-like flavin-dependent oxidoreductase (luciferase family)